MAVPALILGGAALIGGGIKAYGAYQQREAAEDASAQALAAGREGSDIIAGGTLAAGRYAAQGSANAQDFLAQGRGDLSDQQGTNTEIFAQERAAGSAGLDRLTALLTGDPQRQQQALENSPGYQFRLGEGNKAIERAARAAGSFGGGANLKDFARFSQGLASAETDKIVSRLMGLAGIGSAANRAEAGLNTGLAGELAGQSRAQGQTAFNTGQLQAQIEQQGAIAQANSLNQSTTNVNNLQLQSANASAHGSNVVGGTVSELGKIIGLAAK